MTQTIKQSDSMSNDISSAIESKLYIRGLRATEIEKVDEETRSIELSFSSEAEVERSFGIEVLGHQADEIRMDWLRAGTAPLLLDHEWDKQIGVVESASVGADRKGRAVVRFGKSALADEVFNDVKDGIRRNVSVGYLINKMALEEGNGETYSDRYRVVDWEPFELSIVAVPADRDVGVGRSHPLRSSRNLGPIEVVKPESITRSYNGAQQENNNMTHDTQAATAPASTLEDSTIASEHNIRSFENKIRVKEQERMSAIRAISSSLNMEDMGEKAIREGTSATQFNADILAELARTQPDKVRTIKEDDGLIGLNKKEAKSFSFLRAIDAVANNNAKLAPFEMEVINATREKFKHRSFEGQIQVPLDVMMAKRDLTKGGATTGAELVG